MSQNREAPAYQEYAAAMMARIEYRAATLAERGLMDTMRRECWVNMRLPEDAGLLGKVLGFPEKEIRLLLPAVMPFFIVTDGYIICPELEDYRNHLKQRKTKQSEGGKVGSALTNKKKHGLKNRTDIDVSSTPSSNSSSTLKVPRQVPRRGSVESLVQLSTVKQSQDQSLIKELSSDPWLDEYNAADKARVTI